MDSPFWYHRHLWRHQCLFFRRASKRKPVKLLLVSLKSIMCPRHVRWRRGALDDDVRSHCNCKMEANLFRTNSISITVKVQDKVKIRFGNWCFGRSWLIESKSLARKGNASVYIMLIWPPFIFQLHFHKAKYNYIVWSEKKHTYIYYSKFTQPTTRDNTIIEIKKRSQACLMWFAPSLLHPQP